MHALSIADALVEAASREAVRHGGKTVTRITCRVGMMRQVDGRLLEEAFAAARAGTICEGAELAVEKVGGRATCPACDVHVAEWDWRCPQCGELGRFDGGEDELDLLSIEADIDEGGGTDGVGVQEDEP